MVDSIVVDVHLRTSRVPFAMVDWSVVSGRLRASRVPFEMVDSIVVGVRLRASRLQFAPVVSGAQFVALRQTRFVDASKARQCQVDAPHAAQLTALSAWVASFNGGWVFEIFFRNSCLYPLTS